MRLESARDLKTELLTDIIDPFARAAVAGSAARAHTQAVSAVARALAETSTFAVGASPLPRLTDIHRSVALGVTGARQNYRLAIRVQRQALIESPLVEHLVHAASGEAEVRFIGRVEKRSDRNARRIFIGHGGLPDRWHVLNARPVLIGSSVGHVRVTAGTVGAFVRRDGRYFILSNNHVLADEGRASEGESVLQRATADGGLDPEDRVGRYHTAVPLTKDAGNQVDAALAEIDGNIECDPRRMRELVDGSDRALAGLGPELVDVGDRVYKIGRTTGSTAGRVTAFDVDNVVVSYGIGNLRFDGQVEIEGEGARAFSDGGDSGALIVNESIEAVGLLFAGNEVGGSNQRGLTFANPIHRVLKDLGVEFVT
jgi:hypothetical protein